MVARATKEIDRGWKRSFEEQRRLKDTVFVDVGVLAGTLDAEGELPLAHIYAVLEKGTNRAGRSRNVRIPPRPTLGAVTAQKAATYKAFQDGQISQVRAGRMTAAQALNRFGEMVATDVKQKITDLKSPALAPSTRRNKARVIRSKKKRASFIGGSGNPLIDTGHLRRNIDFRVKF